MPYPIDQTQAISTYFKGHQRFGRTTTLVHRVSGEKLIEVMGIVSRKDAYRAYAEKQARKASDEGEMDKAFKICVNCGLGMGFYNILAA
jgi:hypothetical protein